MTEYLYLLLLVSITVSVAQTLSHASTSSSVRLALGLILVCTVVSPVKELAGGISSEWQWEFSAEVVEYDSGCTDLTAEAFEEGIALAVQEKFGVSSGVKVSCSGFDLASLTAGRIHLTLSGEAGKLDYRAVRDFVEENFTKGGKCEVEILGR